MASSIKQRAQHPLLSSLLPAPGSPAQAPSRPRRRAQALLLQECAVDDAVAGLDASGGVPAQHSHGASCRSRRTCRHAAVAMAAHASRQRPLPTARSAKTMAACEVQDSASLMQPLRHSSGRTPFSCSLQLLPCLSQAPLATATLPLRFDGLQRRPLTACMHNAREQRS